MFGGAINTLLINLILRSMIENNFSHPFTQMFFPKLLSQIKNCEVVPGIPRLEYKTGTCTELKKLAASC